MKIGIIGGSGLDNPNLLREYKELDIETPFGKPTSKIISGKIGNTEVFFISRHGKKHTIPPSQVNYRANIYALGKLGCKYIIATTAVGSLRQEIGRGDFVILNQFIDFTKHRKISFFESFSDKPEHTPMASPFSEFLRKKISRCCEELNIKHHKTGCVVTIEGPRFSTKAESKMFQLLGADVINMSIAPECILANEAGIEYATIAMSTDYDCWKEDENPVTWEQILKVFYENSEKMKKLLIKVIERINEKEEIKEQKVSEIIQPREKTNAEEFIKSKIRTIPNWPKPGIMFRDITTLIKDAKAFEKTIEILEKRYRNMEIDLIAGIESRGFIFASALASKLNKGLVLVRKPNKLPAEKLREEYQLEYGKDAVEIHLDAIKQNDRVLLIDDLLATGGTSSASCNLIEKLGGKIIEIAFVVELPELKGREKLAKWPMFKIVEFEGE